MATRIDQYGRIAAMTGLLCSTMQGRAQNAMPVVPQTTPTPQIRVEYFGTERGYTIGRSDVVLLCVVRNIGTTPVPEKAMRLHCYAITGLDYTQGDLTPDLPLLAPNQAVAFRWRLAPSENHQALIAAAQVETQNPPPANIDRQSAEPPVTLTVVPRFDTPPRFGPPIAGADLTPQAGTAHGEAWLASNRVALRFLASDRDEPLLLLAAKQGASWQMVATGLPLARVRSCEDGQTPWWETFRWRRARARVEKDRATLTLSGNVGTRWNAELTFEARRDTGAVEGRLRLTARRTTRCYGVCLPRLMATDTDRNDATTATFRTDGSPALLSESEPSPLPDDSRVMAARQSAATFGLTWPLNPPLVGWTWSRLLAPGGTPTAFGVAYNAGRATNGDVVLPGATLEFPFRLFAFGPSDTVRDALRFVMP